MLLFAAACFGQAAGGPAFEVASIRPMEFPSVEFFRGFAAGGGLCGKPPMTISGNRVAISTVTLCGLIRLAYDIPDYRIAGAPAWMNKVDQSLYYTIQAKAEGEGVLAPDQAKQMLQALIADRFQAKLHRENRDLPVYNLVTAKNGSKLSTEPLPAEGACGDPQARTAALSKNPGPALTSCKPNMTMAQLADNLTRNVDRPVLDKTGLAGTYAFILRWTPEGKEAGPDSPPSMFTAVQEQLGLKLEAVKAPLEFLVIDHAEPPGTN
jgi:uncharacterized protein (TIGR03435 family)